MGSSTTHSVQRSARFQSVGLVSVSSELLHVQSATMLFLPLVQCMCSNRFVFCVIADGLTVYRDLTVFSVHVPCDRKRTVFGMGPVDIIHGPHGFSFWTIKSERKLTKTVDLVLVKAKVTEYILPLDRFCDFLG